jgi:hypothetical protein
LQSSIFEGVVEMLEALTGEELIALHDEILARIEAHQFPELVEEDVTDDRETYRGLRCPVCGNLVDGGESLYAVEIGHRSTRAEVSTDLKGVGLSGKGGDFSTLYYWHSQSAQGGHAVSLPSDWDEAWG